MGLFRNGRIVSRRVTQNSQGVSATFHEVTACASQSEHLIDYLCDRDSRFYNGTLSQRHFQVRQSRQWAQLALCSFQAAYELQISFRSSSLSLLLKRPFAIFARYSCSISLSRDSFSVLFPVSSLAGGLHSLSSASTNSPSSSSRAYVQIVNYTSVICFGL